MTEKSYGGSSGIPQPNALNKTKNNEIQNITKKTTKMSTESSSVSKEEIEKYIAAGNIAKQVKEYAKTIIKKNVPLLEIANKIDEKILALNAKPAFPVNLSINEIAAHSTPSPNDTTLAHGLLKFDVGVHIDGYVADTAFSLDLENSDENKKLIESSEKALKDAINSFNLNTPLNIIGMAVQDAISSMGFNPIINLSGHSLAQYELHSGITIPNHSNSASTPISPGAYAIEPFATSGHGQVKDGKPSGIYILEGEGNVRDSFAREVLQFIKEEYQTLPFCSRWLHKKFGSRALIALKRIEDAGILHHYPQLIEKDRKPVAQSEHTIILTENEKIVTT
jgi:methionyl aminopeptidase